MNPKILAAGAIGGMAVPALRAGLKLTQQLQTSIDVTPSYVIGTLVLAVVGMATVWFLDETERKKAFVIGLSLPATISSLGGQVGGPDSKSEGVALLDVFTAPMAMLVGTAHAAQPTTPIAPLAPPAAEPTFDLARYFRLEGPNRDGIAVQFLDRDGKELRNYIPSGTRLENIPDLATTAVLKTRSGVKETVALGTAAGSVTLADATLKKESKLSFLQALGVPSTVKETLSARATVNSVREPGQEIWIRRDDGALDSKVIITGTEGVTKDYLLSKKEVQALYSDGALLPGDKFNVVQTSDPSGRWMKIKLTALAATPGAVPTTNRTPVP